MKNNIVLHVYNIVYLLFLLLFIREVFLMKKACENYEKSIACYYENQEYINEILLKNLPNITFNNTCECVCKNFTLSFSQDS